MGRIVKITEAQYQAALKEGININVVGKNNNTNDKQKSQDAATDLARQASDKYGVDANVNFTNNNDNTGTTQTITTTTEGKLITKKELFENRLKQLKKNSKVYTVKDFFNIVK